MILDRLIVSFDKGLRTLAAPAVTPRRYPGTGLAEGGLSDGESRHSAALMRVNHVGEVCAQALYQGQSITSRSDSLRIELERAAQEEVDHLAWTEQRIAELGGRKSLLNPFWYGGALTIGLLAGACGDRWSLGFLAETERQVGEHLGGHLSRLPEKDGRSREIVSQMRIDELAHAATAVRLGAAELPLPVRLAMRGVARLMTGIAYRV